MLRRFGVSDVARDALILAAIAAAGVVVHQVVMWDGGSLTIPEGTFAANTLLPAPQFTAFPVMSTDVWAASACHSLGVCGEAHAHTAGAASGHAATQKSGAGSAVGAAASELRHFTLATNYRDSINILLHSAGMFGGGIDVVGLGDTRFKRWGEGFGVKVEMLHRYARAIASTDPERLILFTDAFDVVIAGTHAETVAGYRRALDRVRRATSDSPDFAGREPRILFSAELFPMPSEAVIPQYPPHDRQAHFRFLNSGGFICPVRDLVALMDALPYTVESVINDQFYFTDAFLLSQRNASLPWVVLDHDTDVFISMAGVDFETEMHLDPVTRRWKHASTQGMPTVIHFQGYYGLKKGFPKIYDHIRGRLHQDPLFTPWGVLLGAALAIVVPLLCKLIEFPSDATLQLAWMVYRRIAAVLFRRRRDPESVV